MLWEEAEDEEEEVEERRRRGIIMRLFWMLGSRGNMTSLLPETRVSALHWPVQTI
jgi:hypothetical protein